MNYYGAREKKNPDGTPSGVFHYTCMNDGKVWPVGACAENCPGHPSKVEACQHYRDGELDKIEFRDVSGAWPKQKCECCDKMASKRVGPAYLHFQQPFLCDEHATREVVKKIWGDGEFTVSSSS